MRRETNLAAEWNPVPKSKQLHKVRIKPTQKEMGSISPKVRKEVDARSGGFCEVRIRCNGVIAVQQAHIIGRRQISWKTTATDLLDSCLACHKYLDETPEGIKLKRKLAKDNGKPKHPPSKSAG